jgi:hypothetical protein
MPHKHQNMNDFRRKSRVYPLQHYFTAPAAIPLII